MQPLDHYLNQTQTLPPAPQVLVRLLSLLASPDVDAGRIVELVEVDPALTAKVLQRCNSAAAGALEPVAHLNQAVARLGFDEVYRLTASVIAESTLGGSHKAYGLDPGALWRHSAATAIAGRVVARLAGGDENLIFTAALLHDIGKLILNASLKGDEFPAFGVGLSDQSFVEIEKAMFGAEHAELGGRILERWGFPANLVRAVWHHHEPLLARPHELSASCVYLADLIAHIVGYGPGHQAFAIRGRGEVMALLEITFTDLEKLVIETDEQLKQSNWFAPAMS
jgi:putative nucleotidyltransferase with HDIG domain